MIGKIPEYLLDLPYHSCSLYDVSEFGPKFRQSWACELYKIFFGIKIESGKVYIFDKDGNPSQVEYEYLNFDLSKDIYGPALFDSSYPYIGFPKKYYNYVKGNLVLKFFQDSCYEKKDEDYSIYFICNKKKSN